MSARRSARRDEAVRLREECGWSYKRIAKHLGMPSGRIVWWCVMDGAEPPTPAPRRCTSNNRAARPFLCGGILRQPVSEDEDAQIRSLAASGMGRKVIAREIGRSASTVRYRLAVMARDEARAEGTAANA